MADVDQLALKKVIHVHVNIVFKRSNSVILFAKISTDTELHTRVHTTTDNFTVPIQYIHSSIRQHTHKGAQLNKIK